MSMNTELSKTVSILRETRKAILGRGGDISTTAGLRHISDAIFNIPADASIASYEDSSIAYEKNIPIGVEGCALVKMVGGMSIKKSYSNNLCAADGEYTCSGSAMTIPLGNFSNLEVGEYYISFDDSELTNYARSFLKLYKDGQFEGETSQSNQGVPNFTFEITEENKDCDYVLYIWSYDAEYPEDENGALLSGKLKNIFICKADDVDKTYKPYPPQPPMLLSTKPTSLESRGANLLNMACPESVPSATSSSSSAKRIFEPNTCIIGMTRNNIYAPNNVSLHSRTEKSFEITVISGGYGLGYYFKLNPNTDYCVTCESDGAIRICYSFYANDGTFLTHKYSDTKTLNFTTDDYGNVLILFTSSTSNATISVSNIMLNRGTEAAPYKPYSAEPIDTKALPEAVQSLDGWGLGVNAEYNNHLEWRDGRVFYVQKVIKAVLDGVNNKVGYVNTSNSGYYYGMVNLTVKGINGINLVSSYLDPTVTNGTAGHIRINNGSVLMYNYDQTITTQAAWNEWLKNNPITVVYALETPIETDITHLFTDTSPVLGIECGGTIKFNNEYNQPVNSTIKYIRRTE